MTVPAGVVHDLNVCDVAHAPAGKLHAQAQIGILAVHEEALVEATERAESRRVKNKAHARQPVEIRIGFRPVPSEFACRRSEEHTSELQSQFHLVCRLLLEKKKK